LSSSLISTISPPLPLENIPIYPQRLKAARIIRFGAASPSRPHSRYTIVAARANHRLCHVFDNPADFLAFSLDTHYACERN
jgi:hypothetical protein